MQKNKNRPGYKKTKVGWIPEDWECCFGRDIAALITKGSSPNWQGFDYQSDGVLFVTSENVRDGFIDVSDPKFLPLAFNEKLKHSQLADGDILINIVGASIGRVCAYQDTGLPANVNQAVCVFRCRTKVCGGFVLAFLQTAVGRSRLLSSQVESARPNVSLTDVRQLPIPLPSFPEQEAIAEVLDCWDKAIRNYEKKIEKKRNIKKGLMQRLLAGKQRLPGFEGKWKEVWLGEVLVEKPQYGINAASVPYSEDLPTYLRITDISEHGRFLPDGAVSVNNADSKDFYLNSGDLVFARTGASTGKSYLYDRRDGELVYAGFLIKVTPDSTKLNSQFLKCYSETHAYWKWVSIMCTRSGQPGINGNEYASLQLFLPSIDEQNAITSVLSRANVEIQTLERKLSILKAQKQFLLNNLVTGTIRLPQFARRKEHRR